MIDQAYDIFGKAAFGDALFYNNETALRFELALGDSRSERFGSALERASTVAKAIFKDSKNLQVCLLCFGESFVGTKRSFRTMKECEVAINRPYFIDRENIDDGFGDVVWTRIFFKSDLDSVYRMIRGTVAKGLGIKPGFGFDLYIFDPEQGILMHPYDDRGMDILGPNRHRMLEIYAEYYNWLLDYDIAEMNRRYGTK